MGILLAVSLLLLAAIIWFVVIRLNALLKNQEKQTEMQTKNLEAQAKKVLDDKFHSAVAMLGNSDVSVRKHAIFSLHRLAVDHKEFRIQVADFLCLHIRTKTAEERYQEENRTQPSGEIQLAIDALFRYNFQFDMVGLYSKFSDELSPAVLHGAYLAGADFSSAECQNTVFTETNCQRANFESARCQKAIFVNSLCQKASFSYADCQGANFISTNCQKADFSKCLCQGTIFAGAHCDGAYFDRSHCQRATFEGARCRGASFWDAHCQGAVFTNAYCQGAVFAGIRCQGAVFARTQCQGATSLEHATSLSNRVGKNTELANMILSGRIEEDEIEAIEKAKEFLPDKWHGDLLLIMTENKDRDVVHGTPDGILSGVLEKHRKDIRDIIKKLDDIDKGIDICSPVTSELDEEPKDKTDEFRYAVSLLGTGEASVRALGISLLYHLAIDDEKHRNQVVELLCAHIRSKTQDPQYKESYCTRPSSEIQTAIDVLFKGLAWIFQDDFPQTDLSRAYLVGADFSRTNCRKVKFEGANFQKANFLYADCEKACFKSAQCQKTGFNLAECQDTDFRLAHCQGASFRDTKCQRADFRGAHCQGTDFGETKCQGADFRGSHCQGAYFWLADCDRANFAQAHCQGVNFYRTYCQGVNFSGTYCQGANFRGGARCQGSYAFDCPEHSFEVSPRVGKNTDLNTVVVSEEIQEIEIDAIERAKEFMPTQQYEDLQRIIEANKGRPTAFGCPIGILYGVLGDLDASDLLKKDLEFEWGN